MRRACRKASASRTARLRCSPDSRSAPASARHSSRNQYRPSAASRCSVASAPAPSPSCGCTPWNNSWRKSSMRIRGVLLTTSSHMYAPHVAPPHWTGAFTRPSCRGRAPSGAGWLVANVCVRLSAITIGAHTDTPHRRPPSRSQSAWASLKYSCARC